MSSITGELFRISTWGESHGGGVGVVIDGCPPCVPISEDLIQRDLDRRRPGQSKIVTPRAEDDRCEILSGVFDGQTLGSPISIMVRNKDARPSAYEEMRDKYRPSHADYTYDAKYGIRNWQGGGRASARETIGRVAAAAVAKQVLAKLAPSLEIIAYVQSIQHLTATVDPSTITQEQVESNIVRTGDLNMVDTMIEHIETIRADGNSVGGVIECDAVDGRWHLNQWFFIVRCLFIPGSNSLLELNAAQTQLLTLRREAVEAAIRYHLALIEIESLLGNPNPGGGLI